MRRTEGTVKTAIGPKAAQAAPNPRTARAPTTAATAPAAANATGPKCERADHVERAHPGQGLCGYPLPRHGRFERTAQRRSQPGQQRSSRHGDDGKVQG